jgi:hypothetical protein
MFALRASAIPRPAASPRPRGAARATPPRPLAPLAPTARRGATLVAQVRIGDRE